MGINVMSSGTELCPTCRLLGDIERVIPDDTVREPELDLEVDKIQARFGDLEQVESISGDVAGIPAAASAERGVVEDVVGGKGDIAGGVHGGRHGTGVNEPFDLVETVLSGLEGFADRGRRDGICSADQFRGGRL